MKKKQNTFIFAGGRYNYIESKELEIHKMIEMNKKEKNDISLNN
jgi:hypothetical protein